MDYIHPYIPVGMIILVATLFGVISLFMGRILGPRRRGAAKDMAYESGMIPFGDANIRVPIKFYMVAILFLLFDLETIFILAWAVIFNGNTLNFTDGSVAFTLPQFRFFALGEMVVFFAILLVGYVYVWRKGGLEWT